jgi:hypothetical protein
LTWRDIKWKKKLRTDGKWDEIRIEYKSKALPLH